MTEPGSRKRVSQACIPCGQRKKRCDGDTPSCGPCRQHESLQCSYGVSKRNKRQKLITPNTSLLTPGPSNAQDRSSLDFRSPTGDRDHTDRSHSDISISRTPALQSASANVRSGPNLPDKGKTNDLVVSRDVSVQLFKAYFTTIHPMWPILYKPLYDLTDYDGLAEMLPKPVLYAIYSIAACVQPQNQSQDGSKSHELPAPALLFEAALLASQRFSGGVGSEMNAFHPLNLLKPSIEICQALTILALQQHGVSESTSAILLCSLASAMAVELKIHKAMSFDADPVHVQVCSRLWWNIFVLDKMMTCEMGRPVLLRSEDTNTPFPSVSESDEFQLLPLRPHDRDQTRSVKSYTMSGFNTSIQITMIMEKVSREIYSLAAREALKRDSSIGEAVRLRLWKDLQNYHLLLDGSAFRLDPSGRSLPPPVTITNMVFMYHTTILLHRPFISYWKKQGRPLGDISQNASDPLEVCFVAANNVCDILERYVDNISRLPCDLIFPVFTTASTLSHYSQQVGRESSETRQRIDLCVRWLLVLGKSWKNAGVRQQKLTQDLGGAIIADRETNSNGQETTQTFPSQRLNSSALDTGDSDPIPFLPTAASQNLPAPGMSITIDELGFLSALGDPTDEFYAMDANFRELLETRFDISYTPTPPERGFSAPQS